MHETIDAKGSDHDEEQSCDDEDDDDQWTAK